MFDGPVLFLVNSVYQLLTAIHLKNSLLKEKTADILLTDVTEKLRDYQERLKDTGVFQRVLFARTKDLNRKYAVGKEAEISEGFDKIENIFRWILSDELGDYQEIYFSNFDTFTRMLACRYYDSPCRFICYEDGFSTYVIDFLKEGRAPVNSHPKGRMLGEKIEKVLLYEPRLAMRGDCFPNVPLPKINPLDTRLIELLNYVFAYKKPERVTDFIFLEQSFRAEGIKCNDLALMKACKDAVLPKSFSVKPHPRNPENLPFLTGLTGKYTCDAPWELFLLNETPEDITILTVCSNAALTGRIMFGMDIPTVMLYPLFEGRVLWKEDEVLRRYLFRFEKEFAGENYYAPKTIYELRNILRYLGGQYE